MSSYFSRLFLLMMMSVAFHVEAQNQTSDVSPVYPSDGVPYTLNIELADFSLPNGIHSNVFAVHKGKWLLLAGRTNGMHGFDPGNNNFPPPAQNTVVYVVDPSTKQVWFRDLTDPLSGLSQHQVDLLSVTSPQFYQRKGTLYITGGYGVDTASGLFSTKDALTAIDVEELMKWVQNHDSDQTAAQSIRQTFNPIFQVTGGYMARGQDGVTLLMLGQNFTGFYTDSSNGDYTQQVRRFTIRDNGKELSVHLKSPKPYAPNPNYRRRDLNVVPVMHTLYDIPLPGFIAFSGVFTEAGGIWTVPVLFGYDGKPSMVNPASPAAFKQAMNNYASPTIGIFSDQNGKMYTSILGGLTYGYYQNGQFQTDSEIPFTNQVTTVSFSGKGFYKQYLMDVEYPVILSTGTNPGNQLLFGAGGAFIQSEEISSYSNGVINFRHIDFPDTLIGYVVGGIQSTVPNTNTQADSSASPYIFRVTITKK